MIFHNWPMLIGLAAVAVPILIHLLNRRQAKTVDWGAMQFLMASLTTRKRNILIEEIILMVLRCVLLALLALAMAEPLLPSRSAVPWAVVLPCVLAAAVAWGIAGAMWGYRKSRWTLLGVGAALLAVAGATTAREYMAQSRMWGQEAADKDVVIVVDASSSMSMEVDGRRNFDRAIDEAKRLVDSCRIGDAVSVILAGSAARPIVANPTSDRDQIRRALDQAQLLGGSMHVLKALDAASTSLEAGHNVGKRIVILTDGQRQGWHVSQGESWGFLARNLKATDNGVEVICRPLTLPETYRNLAVTNVALSRQVIGTDRPVRIDVTVTNTGTEPVNVAGVRLGIGTHVIGPERVENLAPSASETVHFSHQFAKPGPHVLDAELLIKDAMAADNRSQRVVHVLRQLRVLIVDGASADRVLSGGVLAKIALAPKGDRNLPGRGKGPASAPIPHVVVAPRLVRATDLRTKADLRRVCGDLKQYAVIILSNVPRLPADVAGKVLAFVEGGGGLLIAPGSFTQLRGHKQFGASFYGTWKNATGRTVAPGTLTERLVKPDAPARPAMKTFTHPALAVVADEARSDMPNLRAVAWWRVQADQQTDSSLRTGGLLDTGAPLLIERKLPGAKGYVLMLATGLSLEDSNLPLLQCFVPLMHELVYFLAEPVLTPANIAPGTKLVLGLEPRAGTKPPARLAAGATVKTPDGRNIPVALQYDRGRLGVEFSQTDLPGQYDLILPESLAGVYPARDSQPHVANVVPFVVLDEPAESTLTALTDGDFRRLDEAVALRRADTFEELAAAVGGGIPGEELWRWLALSVLIVLVGETFLTRWIATQRRAHEAEDVAFGDEGIEQIESFRRHRQTVAVAGADSQVNE